MKPNEGYKQARKLLKERFGNNFMVAEAWIKQITEGDPIRTNNPQGVRDLADDVKACVEALRAMDMLEEIDSRCRMVKLVSRLPLYIQGRWRKEAQRTVEITGKYPHIVKFTSFLETVAKELFDRCLELLNRKSVEANSSACGGLENGTSKVSLPIVTVLVRGKGQSDFVRTNALLDHGSNKTFCSVELVNQLGISGQPASLNLKTLNDGKDMLVEEVYLEVMSTVVKRKCREILCLPRVYALNDFPELRSSVATSADVYRWNHLNDVLVPHRQNVSLLIGQDVPKGLMPIEVRRGKDGEPYVIKTVLGWTINGPLGNISEDLHMASACHFVYGKSDSDISLEARVEQFWSIDTGQVLAGSVPELSVDDRRVLKVWNGSIKLKEGHYELSIPFIDECPNFPDNKSLALKRLLYLKKRLSEDTDLHKRYTKEVNKLFDKGYAECIPSTCNTEEGKLWYLPHHAVSNPNKPDKLRVVFDCAAECKNTSLNKNVSQGQDLANKLLGVLLRFRERNIALMADIEAMF
ncbi:uncharacterized protein [Argopecten irradians]|uniref:uncharacterized protein n=2 Tax=Argopecten irradians TaxID=31199 RepID=UPI00371738AC